MGQLGISLSQAATELPRIPVKRSIYVLDAVACLF
jgi:hypothetical protein